MKPLTVSNKKTKPKHTPGPWSHVSFSIIRSPNGRDVADLRGLYSVRELKEAKDNYGMFEEGKANARLIAAAPLMYETLEKILSQIEAHYVEGVPEWVRLLAQRSNDAINKAKGGAE